MDYNREIIEVEHEVTLDNDESQIVVIRGIPIAIYTVLTEIQQ